jgi:hypothetical protein
VFKTHVDAFDSWDASIALKLQELAVKHCELLTTSTQSQQAGFSQPLKVSAESYSNGGWIALFEGAVQEDKQP